MYFMYCDETNKDGSREHVLFFIYGGLVIDVRQARRLHEAIAAIREGKGFRPEDRLKFQGQSKPDLIDRDDWNEAKGLVLDACYEVGARFFAVLVLHAIGVQRDDLVTFQLNTLLRRFDAWFLNQVDDDGLVFIDRLDGDEQFALMRERFQVGSRKPDGSHVTYPRIISYAATCDGSSHLASAADVVLGTFGYCVNQRGEGMERPAELLPRVAPLIWRAPWSDDPWHGGLTMSPARPNANNRPEYQELKEHLAGLGLHC